MIMDGACDIIVEGKLYHLEKDNILILPSNMKHGNYVSDKGCRAIEVFSPPQHYGIKVEEVKKV